jgi:hypothetical protein
MVEEWERGKSVQIKTQNMILVLITIAVLAYYAFSFKQERAPIRSRC